MTSYWAELAGLHKVLLALIETDLNEKVIELWCDSESAVDVLNNLENRLVDMTAAEGDIVKATKELLPQCPNIAIKHIKGHQTDHTRYKNLPFEAQLNEDCDIAAKETMWNQVHPNTRPAPIEGSRATLYLNNNMITTDIKRSISHAAHTEDLRTYIRNKHDWTENDMKKVNWNAIGEAKRRQPRSQSDRTSKLMHSWSNVRHQKLKMGEVGVCPSYGHIDETIMHLFQCENKQKKKL